MWKRVQVVCQILFPPFLLLNRQSQYLVCCLYHFGFYKYIFLFLTYRCLVALKIGSRKGTPKNGTIHCYPSSLEFLVGKVMLFLQYGWELREKISVPAQSFSYFISCPFGSLMVIAGNIQIWRLKHKTISPAQGFGGVKRSWNEM